MRKPTLHDVAAAAGVSYATADRVLNNRGGVAKKSSDRVQAAIAQLGYHRDITAANLSRKRRYRFDFLLPEARGGFFAALAAQLAARVPQHRQLRQDITLRLLPAFDAPALAQAIDTCVVDGVDGLCVVALDHPDVTAALMRARAAAVPVITLVADTGAAARSAYVGIDNRTAGRTAGDLMLLAHRGRAGGLILPVMGSAQARDHADRCAGLHEVAGPTLEILEPLETADDADRLQQMLATALQRHPGITGIYNLGAGVPGLIAALDQHHRAATPAQGSDNASPPRMVVISHELCAPSRGALQSGLIDAVIDQNPGRELDQALRALTRLSDAQPFDPASGVITPAVHFKHNLPPLPADGPDGDT
ncbi:LacI family DNA-binding transcriptional regulator [Phaeobacter sp.]|uniref:LacI family DNA-binding transcriptional regulator n=1 Tax=Phaeobacter sp. TaxID=1902409 RepID=UPI0025DC76E6|nr:LacI family DNA-binding transcriptional regulator [Phaeobacter sp.]